MAKTKLNVLFYDLESLPNKAYIWGCGEQVVRHTQLLPGSSMWGLICIQYCWNDNGPVKVIEWEPLGGVKAMIEKFDAIIEQADYTIGKNSDRFDVKMLNAHRMLNDLPGLPDWSRRTDDLEKQMRKYFRLPSQSLDYISAQLGLGGKIKMEFSDWISIDQYMTVKELRYLYNTPEEHINSFCLHQYKRSLKEVEKLGNKAFDKMCYYGKKDVRDTRAIWNKLSKHFEPKFNVGRMLGHTLACKICGSQDLAKSGTRFKGNTKYQRFTCNNCHYTGNRANIKSNGDFGAIL